MRNGVEEEKSGEDGDFSLLIINFAAY